MSNIILIGMPTSGKSTVGVVLAKMLGMDFADTDLLLQKEYGQMLGDMTASMGLKAFLKAEEELCCSLSFQNCVIATGGSVVYGEKAMEHFLEIGKIIYLDIDCGEFLHRLKDARARGVVFREGQSLEELYAERTRLYQRWAQITVPEKGLSLEQTVHRAAELYLASKPKLR